MDEKTISELFPASPGMLSPKPKPAEVDAEVRAAFPNSWRQMSGEENERSPQPTAPSGSDTVQDAELRSQVERWGFESRAAFGAEFEQAVADARSLIARYGDDDLRAALNQTGLGNHKALIRLLARIAREGR